MLESHRTSSMLLRLVTLLVLCPSGLVSATQGTASGGVIIEDAAGVGVAYDVKGVMLAAVVMVSQPNSAVLVRVEGTKKGFIPGQQSAVTRAGTIVLVDNQLVSVNYAPVNPGLLQAPGATNMIVLAQFN